MCWYPELMYSCDLSTACCALRLVTVATPNKRDTEIYKPGDYDLLYPQKLLWQVVGEFYEFYQNADLASYPEIIANGGTPIAKILNDASCIPPTKKLH